VWKLDDGTGSRRIRCQVRSFTADHNWVEYGHDPRSSDADESTPSTAATAKVFRLPCSRVFRAFLESLDQRRIFGGLDS
jgi:hypothetical protein